MLLRGVTSYPYWSYQANKKKDELIKQCRGLAIWKNRELLTSHNYDKKHHVGLYE